MIEVDIEMNCAGCGEMVHWRDRGGECGKCGAAGVESFGERKNLRGLLTSLWLVLLGPVLFLICLLGLAITRVSYGPINGEAQVISLNIMACVLQLYLGGLTVYGSRSWLKNKGKDARVWRWGLWLIFVISSVLIGVIMVVLDGAEADSWDGSDGIAIFVLVNFYHVLVGLLPVIYLMRVRGIAVVAGREWLAWFTKWICVFFILCLSFHFYVLFTDDLSEPYFVKNEQDGELFFNLMFLFGFTCFYLSIRYYVLVKGLQDRGRVYGEVISRSDEIGDDETADTLRFGFACDGCGYSLWSKRMRDDCPECGHGIKRSLGAENFVYSCEKWRGQLTRGLWYSMMVPLVLLILVSMSEISYQLGIYDHYDDDQFGIWITGVKLHIFELIMIAVCFGIFLKVGKHLGAREPVIDGQLKKIWSYRVLRGSMILGIIFVFYLCMISRGFYSDTPTLGLLLPILMSGYLYPLNRICRSAFGRLHYKKLALFGTIQTMIQIVSVVACSIGFFEIFSGGVLSDAMGLAHASELLDLLLPIGQISFLMGLCFAYFYHLFVLIVISRSVDIGRVRRPFIPGFGDGEKLLVEK